MPAYMQFQFSQPPRTHCNFGGHKSLLAAHSANERKFLRQRTKSGRATKLHFKKAGYEWKDSSNRWVKTKNKKSGKVNNGFKIKGKVGAKTGVNCDKSTRGGRLNNRTGKC